MSRKRSSKHLSDPYSVLKRPILTEKSHDGVAAGADENKSRYTFEVHVKSNKDQIKRAIEAAFGVKVLQINTMIVKPRSKAFRGRASKPGFTRMRKKAIIRLTADSKKIELI